MPKYKIITSCTEITEYVVEAESQEEAESKFWDGEYLSDKVTDHADENIEEISETE